jgi:hypothetical protein
LEWSTGTRKQLCEQQCVGLVARIEHGSRCPLWNEGPISDEKATLHMLMMKKTFDSSGRVAGHMSSSVKPIARKNEQRHI